jgi:hypothetical protein
MSGLPSSNKVNSFKINALGSKKSYRAAVWISGIMLISFI